MSQLQQPVQSRDIAELPGAPIVTSIRRLLVASLVSGVAYALLMHSSMGFCPGGISGDGGFIDSAGNAVSAAPNCISITLEPSPFMYIIIAVIILAAISMVLRRARDVQGAVKILNRAAAAIGILVVVAIIISQVWFALIPITEWADTGSYSFFSPFPFGIIDIAVTPMNGS